MKEKIISFNLRVNVPGDQENAWPYRLKSVVSYLKMKQPLIIGTQEAVQGMIDDLHHHLPEYQILGVPRSDDPINGEYSAILYDAKKLRVRMYATEWISRNPYTIKSRDFDAAFPRLITYAEFYFKADNTKKFRVFNTHLDHQSAYARLEGVKQIERLIHELNEKEWLPSIILGDFNATRNDEPIQYLLHNHEFTYANSYIKPSLYGTSFHGFSENKEGEPIDHIFVSQSIPINSCQIFFDQVDHHYLSDHYPLEVDIEI